MYPFELLKSIVGLLQCYSNFPKQNVYLKTYEHNDRVLTMSNAPITTDYYFIIYVYVNTQWNFMIIVIISVDK